MPLSALGETWSLDLRCIPFGVLLIMDQSACFPITFDVDVL